MGSVKHKMYFFVFTWKKMQLLPNGTVGERQATYIRSFMYHYFYTHSAKW